MNRSHYQDHSEVSLNRRSRCFSNTEDYEPRTNQSSSQSPVRDEQYLAYEQLYDPDMNLRLKWMDYSPRMSRIRENRQKRLINKLEVKYFIFI